MGRLLEVKGLETRFFTQDGVVNAVNGISYTWMKAKPWPSSAKAGAARASA